MPPASSDPPSSWEGSPTSTADRTPHWSLTNYLRSDPAYYQYQFYDSVRVAVKKGDLRVLEWLMGHFSGCQVSVSIVGAAAEEGRLDVLQLLASTMQLLEALILQVLSRRGEWIAEVTTPCQLELWAVNVGLGTWCSGGRQHSEGCAYEALRRCALSLRQGPS